MNESELLRKINQLEQRVSELTQQLNQKDSKSTQQIDLAEKVSNRQPQIRKSFNTNELSNDNQIVHKGKRVARGFR